MLKHKASAADWCFLLFLWALFVVRWGYVAGDDDHFEYAAYGLFVAEPEAFANDLFLQSVAETQPNERTVVGWLFAQAHPHQEAFWLSLHLASALLLGAGLLLVSGLFVPGRWARYAVVLLSLVGLYGYEVGGTELLGNSMHGTNLVSALSVWAMWFTLRGRQLGALGLLVAATAIQPIAGAQIGVLLGAVWAWQTFGANTLPTSKLLMLYLIWVLTAGVYIIAIWIAYSGGGSAVGDQQFFDIVMRLRAPHHFLPSHFPAKGWVVVGGLTVVGLVFFWRAHGGLFWLLATLAGGMAVYAVLVECFEVFGVAATQWFRSAPWAKYLGLVAVFAVLGKLGVRLKGKVPYEGAWWLAGAATITILIYAQPSVIPFRHKKYYLPELAYRIPEYVLARQVRDSIPADAVFIQPFGFQALKFHGRRSSWVDFKGFARSRRKLPVWASRVGRVYGLTMADAPATMGDMRHMADRHFLNLTRDTLQAFAAEGVSHILTFANHPLPGMPVVLQTPEYKVVEIRPAANR